MPTFWVNEKERAAAVELRWCQEARRGVSGRAAFSVQLGACSTLVKLEGAGSSPELGKGKPHKGLGGH